MAGAGEAGELRKIGDPLGRCLGQVNPAGLDCGRRGVEPRLLVVLRPNELSREATVPCELLVEGLTVGGVLDQDVERRVEADQL